ncbi:MAG: hypothetical protein ACHP65_04870 [Legionellales bacterium]
MKKILVIAPIMPQPQEIESIKDWLSFLAADYSIDVLDPLTVVSSEGSNEEYYQTWRRKLLGYLSTHDAFFGFSLGGVILQQCLSVFNLTNKPIVLFSTPTIADSSLLTNLGDVIRLCQQNQLQNALMRLYEPVLYPNKPPTTFNVENESLALTRLISGLQRVLETDSTAILNETVVNHLHLIGAHSQLVNINNVMAPKTGRLLLVPDAGMRVLQDNEAFCKKMVLAALNDDI